MSSQKNVLYREGIISKLSQMRGRQREDEADGPQEMSLRNSFISLGVYVMLIGADYQRCPCEEKAKIGDDRQKGMRRSGSRWPMGNVFLVDVRRRQKHLNDG